MVHSLNLLNFNSQMGARHVRYGVEERHYGFVGQALLKTIAQIADDAWTAELQQVWSDAIHAVAQLMLAGAASVEKYSCVPLSVFSFFSSPHNHASCSHCVCCISPPCRTPSCEWLAIERASVALDI